MKIAIYVRVSTLDQTNENQKIELLGFCERMGYEVFNVYEDVISGTKDSRPGLDKLIKDARLRKFDSVLVWKLDRLGRSMPHLVKVVQELQHLGISINCVSQGINTETSQGRMFMNIMGSLAEFERELIVERTKLGLKRAVKEGKKLGRKPISDYHKQKIISLRRKGLSMDKIKENLRVSKGTIHKVLTEWSKSHQEGTLPAQEKGTLKEE